MGDELGVRKFVHAKLLALDQHYTSIKMIHMKEDTGEIVVEWYTREGEIRKNYFQFSRKV
jgi:hypothetical protein